MYGIIAAIDIKPEFKQKFMLSMLDDARGSATREPGCLRFDVLQDANDHHRIYLMEEYIDEGAFRAHTRQPHFTKWRDTVKEWFAAPPEVIRVSGIYPPGD